MESALRATLVFARLKASGFSSSGFFQAWRFGRLFLLFLLGAK